MWPIRSYCHRNHIYEQKSASKILQQEMINGSRLDTASGGTTWAGWAMTWHRVNEFAEWFVARHGGTSFFFSPTVKNIKIFFSFPRACSWAGQWDVPCCEEQMFSGQCDMMHMPAFHRWVLRCYLLAKQEHTSVKKLVRYFISSRTIFWCTNLRLCIACFCGTKQA